jgi:lysophospholipase
MPFVLTPDNPRPPGGVEAFIRAADGVRLRVARWAPETAARGTVAVLHGRNEFIEKYFEMVGDLLRRGFAVATFDWRGQGRSDRQLRNARKGHVDDFSHYERDVEAFVKQVLEAHCPRPWFALAHSMGAAVLLPLAQAGRLPFERCVLTSPMIALASVKRPRAAQWLAEELDALGLGGVFAPGGGSKSPSTEPFARNEVTSDAARYARTGAIIAADGSIALGGPTIGWIHAALRQMRRFEDVNLPRTTQTPILVIAAGRDRVASTRAAERYASLLKAGRIVVIDGAEHEVMMERDGLRDQFWAAFDQFIPGGGAPPPMAVGGPAAAANPTR